jgi:DNA polymerase-3 subunit delta'
MVGHAWALDLLTRQLAQGRVAHAYLFTGPPQVGKGTLARWFAQALLCEAPDGWPCGVCLSCQRVEAGSHPDVRALSLEVQPGGRRTLGIEAVRAMRSGMAERPYSGRRKVYLIEDAEAMTDEAQNALLKTLEEPPSFVVILLAALSDHALLPTVVSRCQLLPLRPLAQGEVRQALTSRWGAAEDQAGLLAGLSRGRLGWAVQALRDAGPLQQRDEHLSALTVLLGAGLLERFGDAEEQERKWKRGNHDGVLDRLESWQGWWRDLLLVSRGCTDLVVNVDRLEGLRAAAQQVSPERVLQVMCTLRQAQQQLNEQVNPRLVFEDLFLQLPAVVI